MDNKKNKPLESQLQIDLQVKEVALFLDVEGEKSLIVSYYTRIDDVIKNKKTKV